MRLPNPPNDKFHKYIMNGLKSNTSFARGGVRAGKNVWNTQLFCMRVEESDEEFHIAGAVNSFLAKQNIIECNGLGVLNYFEGRCTTRKVNGIDTIKVNTPKGVKTILCINGGNKDRFRSIKGLTVGGVYITEINECDRAFVEMADTRNGTSKRPFFIGDYNEKNASHYFYELQEKVFSKRRGFNIVHVTIADNTGLTTEQKVEFLKKYPDKNSLTYLRDIKGLVVTLEGLIYNGAKIRKVNKFEALTMKYRYIFAGVDIGGRDATVCTLVGWTYDDEIVLIDGYYHKQGEKVGMSHSIYAKNIAEFLSQYKNTFRIDCVNCDSANKLFVQDVADECRKAGVYTTVEGREKLPILERINLENKLIYEGRLIMSSHMSHWENAFNVASWAEDKSGNGNSKRLDNGTYEVDCLDSFEYALQPIFYQL